LGEVFANASAALPSAVYFAKTSPNHPPSPDKSEYHGANCEHLTPLRGHKSGENIVMPAQAGIQRTKPTANEHRVFPETAPINEVEDVAAGCILCTLNGPVETGQKPFHPICNIKFTLLGFFQQVVIIFAVSADLRRHAVKVLIGFLSQVERNMAQPSIVKRNPPGDGGLKSRVTDLRVLSSLVAARWTRWDVDHRQ
jgi:hypothetical protein